MATASARGRIHGLDTARAVAIALAMLAHACFHFGLWPQLPEAALTTLRATTRAATPTFIILFGMMLEIVYLKMVRRGDRRACWTRLLTRAIQCYLLYLCVVAAGIAGGHLSASQGFKASLFLDRAYFANILKFYSLGLLAGIALLELRVRFGLVAVAVVMAAIWACYPAIKALPPVPEAFELLASFLIGAGDETGPSVLQGMSLVALGMLLGNGATGLLSEEAAERAAGRRLLAVVVIGIAAALGALLLVLGPGQALTMFVEFRFRAANHPSYYVMGSAAALAIIAGSTALAARVPRPLLATLSVFGTSSLFAYTLGNIVLNLVPKHYGGLSSGLMLTGAFLLCLYGATLYFQMAQRAADRAATHSLAAHLGRISDRLRQGTARAAALCIDRLLPQQSDS